METWLPFTLFDEHDSNEQFKRVSEIEELEKRTDADSDFDSILAKVQMRA
jgi:hypothetical protein